MTLSEEPESIARENSRMSLLNTVSPDAAAAAAAAAAKKGYAEGSEAAERRGGNPRDAGASDHDAHSDGSLTAEGRPGHPKATDTSLMEMNAKTAPSRVKLMAALMYGVMSIGIMMLTKAILTEFDFRCFVFVGFLQYLTTAVILLLRRFRGNISFPLRNAFRILFVDLFPLPMVFMFNTLSGLGATQSLNMPLFVLMRRLSIAMTLFGEAVFLRYRHDWETRTAVGLMILGALVATSFNMQAPLSGIVFVLVNDVCTALNGVLTRWRLDENKLCSEGIMFYTNAFAAFFSGAMLLCDVRGELTEMRRYEGWTLPFMLMLALNAVSGFGINFFTYLCMKLNSPLTVSMIGAAKNVVTSYIGMAFSDYTFAMPSFVGVNLSVVGCILYSHREFVRMVQRQEDDTQQQRAARKEDP
ncbi:UDP-glucuronic acid/UDP-N-acetylgalactosamine transporter [Trypanosoma grayi]|uniref:UDP-glucuronic acid/UDP-N-acetylgalactosamine transporter n=1 Tax=Trypanosoma grayi TaxID=71804 RepID=UPI0004F476E8|nr:UDP-glucuronic acid/UDP-N-acetylgalactosamine transporter [Trypanosoma grayi]KEG07517.1 UDP-glucuronic acid/UDP-N-acetylgalactosamine transporter [Trypanosoma grayi]